MDQSEKIIQISASDEAIYALSSEGKLYMGIHGSSGFEWRKLPNMNPEKMGKVLAKGGNDEEEGATPVFSGNVAELVTATIIRDEKPEEKAPAPEAPKK